MDWRIRLSQGTHRSNVWPAPDPARRFGDWQAASEHDGRAFNYEPCRFTWPCRTNPQIPHLCNFGQAHTIEHRCQCGAECPR